MEYSSVVVFFLGMISPIGYCRLFFSINRPVVRWRFIVMLAVIFLSRPVCIVWQLHYQLSYMNNLQEISLFSTLVSIFTDFISLFACALLGPNRKRAFIASAFVFCVLNSATEIFVTFLIVGIVYPFFDSKSASQIFLSIPQIHYAGIFLFNLVVMCCCFLAARWIRKIEENLPVKLCVLLCLFFLSFSIITSFWVYYALTQTLSSSSFPSALLGALLTIIPLFALYFFTRFAANTKPIPVNEKENASAAPAGYAQFIGQLSKRELEVIEAVLSGCVSQKELAETLNISVNTVKKHLQHIYQTTGAANMAALTVLFSGYSSNNP